MRDMTAAADVDDLEDRLAVIVGQLNALHAQLVDLVAEARDTGAWSGAGIRSLTHWLTWKAGVTNERANGLVRLAAAKTTHPALSTLFADGQLTVDQAAVAVKVPDYADARVAEMAPLATVNQLRTIVRCAQPVTPPPSDSSGQRPPAPVDSVSAYTSDDGRYHLTADLAADHGRILDAALDAARDRIRHDTGTRATLVDALVDVAARSLDGETPARRERVRINLFLDPTGPVPASWPDGTWLPDAIRDHLTCDGLLSPVFTSGGRPVSVGATQRIVPARTRRLVMHRDLGRCRVPWCGARRHLDVHHIVHWLLGGKHRRRQPRHAVRRLPPGRPPRRPRRQRRPLHARRPDVHRPPGSHDHRAAPGRPARPARRREPRHPYEHALGERMDTRSVGAALPDPPQHAPPTTDVA